MTLGQCAEVLGVTPERIRQIESAALKKLAKLLVRQHGDMDRARDAFADAQADRRQQDADDRYRFHDPDG